MSRRKGALMSWALLALSFVSLAVASKVVDDEGRILSCTGATRVCSSLDDPGGSSDCVRNELNNPEIRIYPQNWASATLVAMLAQVILGEVLRVPTVLGSAGSATHAVNFWHGRALGCDGCSAYSWKGLAAGSTAGSAGCSSSECFHAMMEVWSGQQSNIEQYVSVDRVAEAAGPLGVLGKLSLYVSYSAYVENPQIVSYQGLTDATLTSSLFKKPIAFLDYCAHFSSDGCASADDHALLGRAPSTAEEQRFYVEGVYNGYFQQDSIGHVVNAPCSWTTYAEAQIAHNGLALQVDDPDTSSSEPDHGYSYDEILEVYNAAGANDEAILIWWWEPEPLHEQYKYEATAVQDRYRMERVILPAWSSDCAAHRVVGGTRCNGTAAERQGDAKGACDYPHEILEKYISSSLEALSPETHYFLTSLRMTNDDQNGWLGRITLDQTYLTEWPNASSALRARHAVCDWINSNRAEGVRWNTWLLDGYPRTVVEATVRPGIIGALWAMAGCGFFTSLLLAAAVRRLARSTDAHTAETIRYSQPLFLNIVLLGTALNALFIAIFGFVGDVACPARVWLGQISYVVTFAPIFTKNWRVMKIFVNPKLRRMIIKKEQVLRIIASWLLVSVLYLAIWTAMDSSQPRAVDTLSGSTFTRTKVCSVSSRWSLPMLAFDAGILLWGASIAVQTRSVSTKFNESRYIAAIIYNTLVLSIVALAVFQLGRTTWSPLIAGCLLFLHQLAVLGLMPVGFVPKLWAIAYPSRHVLPKSLSQRDSEAPRDTDEQRALIEALQAELAKLKRTNAALAKRSAAPADPALGPEGDMEGKRPAAPTGAP